MKTLLLTLLAILTMTIGAQHALAAESVVITNCSFELGTYHGANPWFGSTLDGWNITTPLQNWVGKCDGSGPSAGHGQRPDRAHVAYLAAGYGIHFSNVRTDLTGLDTSATYVLQFWHNGISPNAGAQYTNAYWFEVNLQGGWGSQLLGAYTNTPVTGSTPFYFEQIIFTPQNADVTLRFRNCPFADWTGGESMLFLDGITLFKLSHANEVIIKNPSFEASASYDGFIGGYAGWLNDLIAGWDCGGFGFGTRNDLSGDPNVDGVNAYRAYLQDWPPDPASSEIKQTVNGLTSGQGYYLRYTYGSANLAPSNFTVSVGGSQVYTVETVPMGVNQRTDTFTANASSMELKFTTTPTEGADLLLDNIMIWPVPEPAGMLLAGLCALALRVRRG